MKETPDKQDENFLSEPLMLTEENLSALREAMLDDLVALGGQILGNLDQAEDVLGDLVAYLLGKIRESGPWKVQHPRGWLYHIYRRRAYSFLRLERPIVSLSSGQEGGAEIDLPDADTARRMEEKILAEELMRAMSDRLRFLVEMRAFKYRWGEIAKRIINDPFLRELFQVNDSVPSSSNVKALDSRLRKIYQREMGEIIQRRPVDSALTPPINELFPCQVTAKQAFFHRIST